MEFIATYWYVWLGMMVLGYSYVIAEMRGGIKMFVFSIVGGVGLVLFYIAAAMFYKSHAG